MIVLWSQRCRPAGRRARGARRTRRGFGVLALLGSLAALGGLAACAPTADDSKLPPEVPDPKTLKTPAGALELYRAALLQLPGAFDQTMVTGAILTDELAAMPTPPNVQGVYTALDSRQLLPGGSASGSTGGPGDGAYSRLHRLRAQVREARGFLGTYVTEADSALGRALQGHLYAVEGYADVLLADLYCSGIPLSTVDFEGDYTLKPGSSTREVYRTAVGLFDSALVLLQAPVPDSALAPDSVVLFRRLAAVGRGRALLALGIYDSAALAVATAVVPTEFRYQVPVLSFAMGSFLGDQFDGSGNPVRTSYATAPGVPSVGRNEGRNGLDYLDSTAAGPPDPRVGGVALGEALYHGTYYFPAKYYPGPPTYELASGIEARLIEAEAALRAGSGEWLTLLNTLRQTALPGTVLPDTTDPGSDTARVSLLFRERAFWLYLTAHREGDLRRLVRQYGRGAESAYPTGEYAGASGSYGSTVVVPVPEAERKLNPQYSGCISTGA